MVSNVWSFFPSSGLGVSKLRLERFHPEKLTKKGNVKLQVRGPSRTWTLRSKHHLEARKGMATGADGLVPDSVWSAFRAEYLSCQQPGTFSQ